MVGQKEAAAGAITLKRSDSGIWHGCSKRCRTQIQRKIGRVAIPTCCSFQAFNPHLPFAISLMRFRYPTYTGIGMSGESPSFRKCSSRISSGIDRITSPNRAIWRYFTFQISSISERYSSLMNPSFRWPSCQNDVVPATGASDPPPEKTYKVGERRQPDRPIKLFLHRR